MQPSEKITADALAGRYRSHRPMREVNSKHERAYTTCTQQCRILKGEGDQRVTRGHLGERLVENVNRALENGEDTLYRAVLHDLRSAIVQNAAAIPISPPRIAYAPNRCCTNNYPIGYSVRAKNSRFFECVEMLRRRKMLNYWEEDLFVHRRRDSLPPHAI